MDLPINQFKRAIAFGARRSARGSEAARRRPRKRWAASGSASRRRHGAHADRHAADDRYPADDRGDAGAGDRAPAVERHGDDQACARCGAQSLLLPFVTERRRGAARGLEYALSAGGRARRRRNASRSCYGTVPNYLKRAARNCVIVQIETLRARQAGRDRRRSRHRFDFHRAQRLSASMVTSRRHRGTGTFACRRAGKPSGIIGPTPETAARFIDYGYSRGSR